MKTILNILFLLFVLRVLFVFVLLCVSDRQLQQGFCLLFFCQKISHWSGFFDLAAETTCRRNISLNKLLSRRCYRFVSSFSISLVREAGAVFDIFPYFIWWLGTWSSFDNLHSSTAIHNFDKIPVTQTFFSCMCNIFLFMSYVENVSQEISSF